MLHISLQKRGTKGLPAVQKKKLQTYRQGKTAKKMNQFCAFYGASGEGGDEKSVEKTGEFHAWSKSRRCIRLQKWKTAKNELFTVDYRIGICSDELISGRSNRQTGYKKANAVSQPETHF